MTKYSPDPKKFITSNKLRSANSLNIDNSSNKFSYPDEESLAIETDDLNLFVFENDLLGIYLPEIKSKSSLISFDAETIRKYEMQPKLLSTEYYNIPDYWFLILAVNNYRSAFEFKGFTSIYMPDRAHVETIVNDIEKRK